MLPMLNSSFYLLIHLILIPLRKHLQRWRPGWGRTMSCNQHTTHLKGFWAQRWCTCQEKPATTSVVLISQWIYDDDVQGIKIDTFLSSSNASGCQALPLSFAHCHFRWFDVKSILIPWFIPNAEYKFSMMSFRVPYTMSCTWSILNHCYSYSTFVGYVFISHWIYWVSLSTDNSMSDSKGDVAGLITLVTSTDV